MIWGMLRAVSAALLTVCVCGCVTTKTTPDKPNTLSAPVTKTNTGSMSAADKSNYFDVDSCADRLHTIEGQIILYYAKYHRLPSTLLELRQFADPGDDTSYTCPVSHQSYVYVTNGLVFGSDPRRLIVFDATPAHNGNRWGILFSPAKGRQPLTTTVIPIPESSMKGFVPAPPVAQPVTTMPSQQQPARQ
jgi:hypothetical protein